MKSKTNINNSDSVLKYCSGKIISICHTVAWYQILNRYVTIFVLLILTGCSAANLNSEDRKKELRPLAEKISIQQLRHEVLLDIDPRKLYQKGAKMKVNASDIWESSFIRWMTPLSENAQKFRASLSLYHQDIDYTFLNGQKKGQTIGFDGQSYEYIGTQKNYKDSTAISLYLESLQSYFEWNQTLLRKSTLTILGMKEIKKIPYWVVYATEGPTKELDKYDQYLIYINIRSGRIDYIEFTMRKLMKAYKGVIHYQNYKVVQGILMPFWIGVADSITQPEFDHYFVVESIEFDRPE